MKGILKNNEKRIAISEEVNFTHLVNLYNDDFNEEKSSEDEYSFQFNRKSVISLRKSRFEKKSNKPSENGSPI